MFALAIILFLITGLSIYMYVKKDWKKVGRLGEYQQQQNLKKEAEVEDKVQKQQNSLFNFTKQEIQYPLPSENDPFKVLKDYSPERISKIDTNRYSHKFTRSFVTNLGPTKDYWQQSLYDNSKVIINDDYNTIITSFYKNLLEWLYIKIDNNSESEKSLPNFNEKLEFLAKNQHFFNVSDKLFQRYLDYRIESASLLKSQNFSKEANEQFEDRYNKCFSEEERKLVNECLRFLTTPIYASIEILKSVNTFISEFYPVFRTSSLKVKCEKLPPFPFHLHYEMIQIIKNDFEPNQERERFSSYYYSLYEGFKPRVNHGFYVRERNRLGILYFKSIYGKYDIDLYKNLWPIIANFHEALKRIGNEHIAEKYAEDLPESISIKSVSNMSTDEFRKVMAPIWQHHTFIEDFKTELIKNPLKVPNELSEKPWTKEKLERIRAINKIELDAYNKREEQYQEQLRKEREIEAARLKQRKQELKLERHYIGEGHYRNGLGEDYMSIWTYKRKNGILGGDNYQEALQIYCDDKFNGPFNQSNEFSSGWMYNITHLDKFYKR